MGLYIIRHRLYSLCHALLASQSDAHRIAPHRDPNPSIHTHPNPLIALKQERPMMRYIFQKEIVQGPQKQCYQVKNKNLENLENLEKQERNNKKNNKKNQKKPKIPKKRNKNKNKKTKN